MGTAPLRDKLQQATALLKAGRNERARQLILEVLKVEPGNAQAWVALAEAEATTQARLRALERAAALAPEDVALGQRLAELRAEWRAEQKVRQAEAKAATAQRAAETRARLNRAQRALAVGRREEAQAALLELVAHDERCERAWWLLSDLVPDLNDQITALENILTLNPRQGHARRRLENLRHLGAHPLELGKLYESQGELERAAEAYLRASVEGVTPAIRAEAALRHAEARRLQMGPPIRRVGPDLTLMRLTLGPLVVYALMVIVHTGLSPWQASWPLLAGGVALAAGGFLMTLPTLRPSHPLWMRWVGAPGMAGETAARGVVWLAGLALTGVAYGPFVLEALARLAQLRAQFP